GGAGRLPAPAAHHAVSDPGRLLLFPQLRTPAPLAAEPAHLRAHDPRLGAARCDPAPHQMRVHRLDAGADQLPDAVRTHHAGREAGDRAHHAVRADLHLDAALTAAPGAAHEREVWLLTQSSQPSNQYSWLYISSSRRS